MLGDVLDAATAHAERVRLVTDDAAASLVATKLGVELIADPGGGQGPAVQAALGGIDGCCLVVNADLPCATPEALARLAAHGAGFVAAADGTTNALSLPGAGWFAPLYGPGSATRFASAGLTGASIPELEHDVDTLSDLDALTLPPGLRTLLVLSRQRSGLARTQ
jgi:2-phospho-L-lactate guanylyltransferase (CobY/MobA/RfbA family)